MHSHFLGKQRVRRLTLQLEDDWMDPKYNTGGFVQRQPFFEDKSTFLMCLSHYAHQFTEWPKHGQLLKDKTTAGVCLFWWGVQGWRRKHGGNAVFTYAEKEFIGVLTRRLLRPLMTGSFSRGPHRWKIVKWYLEALVAFCTQEYVQVVGDCTDLG